MMQKIIQDYEDGAIKIPYKMSKLCEITRNKFTVKNPKDLKLSTNKKELEMPFLRKIS